MLSTSCSTLHIRPPQPKPGDNPPAAPLGNQEGVRFSRDPVLDLPLRPWDELEVSVEVLPDLPRARTGSFVTSADRSSTRCWIHGRDTTGGIGRETWRLANSTRSP
jgi:hypothetical protein